MYRTMVLILFLAGLLLAMALVPFSQAAAPEAGGNNFQFLPIAAHPIPIQTMYARLQKPRYGPFVLIGEVKNVGLATAYDVTLVAEIYLNDVLTRTYVLGTMLPAIFQGETSPIQIGTDLHPCCMGEVTDIVITLRSLSTEPESAAIPISVITKSIGCSKSSTIGGLIRNDNSITAGNLIVIHGGVDGLYGQGFVEKDVLAPGEITAYYGLVFFAPCDPDHVDVWAQGEVIDDR